MDLEKIERGMRLILEGIGEDPNRPGLVDTPRRYARMCQEIFGGLEEDPAPLMKVVPGESHDEMVIIKQLPLYSVCEHHLLPFIGEAHIAYIPERGRIVGLSKLARVLEILSRRPQIQERLTTQMADLVNETLKPMGVMIVIEAEHLCMSMRGVKRPHTMVVTSALHGVFRQNRVTRQEALELFK